MNPILSWYFELDQLSLKQLAATGFSFSVQPSFVDEYLVYRIALLVGNRAGCEFVVARGTLASKAIIDIQDAAFPDRVFNHDVNSLKKTLLSWLTFGWNDRSTIARAIKAAAAFFNALYAEEGLANGLRHAPLGTLVIHNTNAKNVDSILAKGLKVSHSKCGPGIWSRPPSYGVFDRTYFKGGLSLVVDISGLRIKSASGYEVVIAEDIDTARFVRALDLNEKQDA